MEKGDAVLQDSREVRPESPIESRCSEKSSLDGKTLTWIVINAAATVAIVYVNKSIFTAPSFRNCQLTFVAFHFAITYGTLYIASRPFLGGGMFAPSRSNSSGASSPWTLLPLTVAMAGNVVFMNLSLAHSSVIFYQIVRILLTPLTALLNLFIYRAVIPWGAVLALAPACIGVGIVSFIEATAQSPSSRPLQSTSVLGVVFAFTGVAVSALYTVWVAAYHRSLNLSSVQLLYKQMPLGGLMLLVVGYFTDTYPVWSEVTTRLWGMLILSGLCAVSINVSQFHIITHAGPVSSTVVGHLKTVLVIGLGWTVRREPVGAHSAAGIVLALVGIFGYSYALYLEQRRSQSHSQDEREDI